MLSSWIHLVVSSEFWKNVDIFDAITEKSSEADFHFRNLNLPALLHSQKQSAHSAVDVTAQMVPC